MSSSSAFKLISQIKALCILGAIALGFSEITSFHATSAQSLISNGKIAFASNQDGDFEIYTMNPDGSDIVQLTHNDVDDHDPNWSPDGSQIVYTSYRNETGSEIYLMNSDGSNQRNLSNFPGADFDPEWSPSGDRIVFISFRTGPLLGVPNIFTISPDGSNLTQITFGQGEVGGNFYQPNWSPDGQQLAYLKGELGGSARGSLDSIGLYTIELSTLTSVTLPAGPSYNNVDWSPDGETIIFEGVELIEVIQGVNPDGTNYRTMSESFVSQNNPGWSPDGQQIVFEISSTDIGIMDADGQNMVNLTNSPDVWEVDPHWQPIVIEETSPAADAGAEQPLTDSDDSSAQPLVTNGRIAFVSDRDGNQQIYVMDSDGSNVQRLTFSGESNIFPDWSPDGTKLAFQARQNGIWGIYVINADGSGLTNLVNGSDRYPAWSPDGNFIAFARDTIDGSEIYTSDVNGESLRKIVTGGNGTYNLFPVWSPDGERILYVTTDEVVGARSQSTPYFELKTADLITGEEHLLYALNYEGFPDWSWVRSDGSIAITFSGLAGTHIVRLEADGSSTNAKAVTSAANPFSDLSRYTEHPCWSPDGTKIVFDSSDSDFGEGLDYDIYVTDTDNEQLVNLTPGTDSDDIMPDWQPNPVANEPPTASAGPDQTLPDSDDSSAQG